MMDNALYKMLVGIAVRGECQTYGSVSKLLDLDMRLSNDRKKIGSMLCDISWEEYRSDRPLLSAVVVRGRNGKPTSNPGKGFYVMAREMGFEFQDETEFFNDQLSKVHAYWSKKR